MRKISRIKSGIVLNHMNHLSLENLCCLIVCQHCCCRLVNQMEVRGTSVVNSSLDLCEDVTRREVHRVSPFVPRHQQ